MKAIYTSLSAACAAALLAGCTGMRLSNSSALVDDVYYDGSAKLASAPAVNSSDVVSDADVASYNSRVASYASSRSSANSSSETRDFSAIQQYYSNASNGSDSVPASSVKTLIAQAQDAGVEVTEADGVWLDGFNGSDADQSYDERIIRFHRPLVTVSYYSPFFTSARYSGDWNVYVDNYGSTYMVPTWSNPWYDDFYYGSMAWNWGWGSSRWYYGWGYPNYYGWGYSGLYGYHGWHHGWGFGYGYGCSAWGWGYGPYYHHHHYGYYGHGYYGHGGYSSGHYSHRYASRNQTAPRSYSRANNGVTTNPNGVRAGERYRDNNRASYGSRSYTRPVGGGASTQKSLATTSGRRDSGSASSSAGNTRRDANTDGSSFRSNSRRTSNAVVGSSSRSSYTPSAGVRSNSNKSAETRSYGSSSRRQSSSSSSSYSQSNRQRNYSSSNNSRGNSSSRSSYSSGSHSSSHSSGGSFSGGGSRGGGSHSGGGGSRGGRR